ncbi:putative transposable element [Trichonephila clavipes]|nr:putative transposable element [Trichonephila clavipes]
MEMALKRRYFNISLQLILSLRSSLVVRASDSRPEGLGSMLDVAKYPPSAHGFTCRNCGGGDRGRVAICRPFGQVSLSLNRTVTCMVLKANDRRTSCPCHDEFCGPRSDYVRQGGSEFMVQTLRVDTGQRNNNLLYRNVCGRKQSGKEQTGEIKEKKNGSHLVPLPAGVHYMHGQDGNDRAVLPMYHAQFPDRRMPDYRIFHWLHRQSRETRSLQFQQDGETCHTARATIDLLKDRFGDRLISRFGPVNWPPRSCDLTPLDYFLWGYVKSLVYADKPQTFDHLEDNIRRVIADIRPQMLEKVIENWTSRLDYIRASRGSPMEEIIFEM